MSKVICIAGESGSGKTTAMRNLDPKATYYIDADKKGLGAFSVDGKMVDKPVIERAQKIIKKAEKYHIL